MSPAPNAGADGAGCPAAHDTAPEPSTACAAALHVSVVYATEARTVVQVPLCLPAGATLKDAIEASGLRGRYAEIELVPGSFGIWGRKAPLDQPLRDADRVEIWRALRVDPKLARRERFQAQGAGQAGLFKQRRPGAKSGY